MHWEMLRAIAGKKPGVISQMPVAGDLRKMDERIFRDAPMLEE